MYKMPIPEALPIFASETFWPQFTEFKIKKFKFKIQN